MDDLLKRTRKKDKYICRFLISIKEEKRLKSRKKI